MIKCIRPPIELEQIDGRPLYAYRLSNNYLEELYSRIREINPEYLSAVQQDYFWMTFVLCAANKASTQYDDDYSWSFFEDLAKLDGIPTLKRYGYISKALRLFKRDIKTSDRGNNQYLASLIIEGGLPLSWFTKERENRIQLMRSIKNLASYLVNNSQEPDSPKDVFLTMDEVRGEVEKYGSAQMWQSETIYNMIADLFNGFIECIKQLPHEARTIEITKLRFSELWQKYISEAGYDDLLPVRSLPLECKLKLLELLAPTLKILESQDHSEEWLKATEIFDIQDISLKSLINLSDQVPLDDFALFFNLPLALLQDQTEFIIKGNLGNQVARGQVNANEVIFSQVESFTTSEGEPLLFITRSNEQRKVFIANEMLDLTLFDWDQSAPLYLSNTPRINNQYLYDVLGSGSASLRQSSCKVIIHKELLNQEDVETAQKLTDEFYILSCSNKSHCWTSPDTGMKYSLELGVYRPEKLCISPRGIPARLGINGTVMESKKTVVFQDLPSVFFRNERLRATDNKLMFKVAGKKEWHKYSSAKRLYGLMAVGVIESNKLLGEAKFMHLPKDFRLSLHNNGGRVSAKISSSFIKEADYQITLDGDMHVSPIIKGAFSISGSKEIPFISKNPSEFFYLCTENDEQRIKQATTSQLFAGKVDAQIVDTGSLEFSARLLNGEYYRDSMHLYSNERVFPLTCAPKFVDYFSCLSTLLDTNNLSFQIKCNQAHLQINVDHSEAMNIWWAKSTAHNVPLELIQNIMHQSEVIPDLRKKKLGEEAFWPDYNSKYENINIPVKLKTLLPESLQRYEKKFFLAPIYAAVICGANDYMKQYAYELMELTTVRLFDPGTFDQIFDLISNLAE